MPAKAASGVSESGRSAAESPGVKFLRFAEGAAVFVKKGTWVETAVASREALAAQEEQAAGWAREHLDAPLTVEDLADQAGMSYLSRLSGNTVTMRFPLPSSRAIRRAAATLAPELMPASMPSSRANRLAQENASSLLTVSMPLSRLVSRFLGMNPAPMP